MKKRKLLCLLGCLCICLSTASFYVRGNEIKASEEAISRVRFGYAQMREYASFAQVLLSIARELAKEGSISKDFVKEYEGVNFEEKFREGDTLKLWNDICDANVKGARYQFTREAFFDMNRIKEADYEKMANRDDVDITFAMGTLPGVYLFEHEKKNRFMSIYAADPIASGIVESPTKRYTKNSYAVVDPTPYLRQIDAGYKFLKFKKLGVVLENSEAAFSYSAVKEIEQKSREHGFEVVYEYVKEPVSKEDYDRYYRELKEAYRTLLKKGIDCLYITVASIEYEKKMQELLDDAIIPAGIKTLAQDDFASLAYGALFGVTISDSAETAAHVVKQLERFTKEGLPFWELDMVFESTPKIGLNYTTAKRIGFEVGFEDLQIIDQVFRNDE